ncbi:twin-arginine translocase subunit TatC [Marinicellulosiphila megalodicopiae]|uniref:twin-arginine translocase subunit TatC n=1 Tax=Marinicellulosiphila megalodicopiae TaxID=2724896 RepID=UPI003BB111F9
MSESNQDDTLGVNDPQSSNQNTESADGMSIFDHLKELRDRLVKIVIFLAVICVATFTMHEYIFDIVTIDLRTILAENGKGEIIITGLLDGIFVPFKLALYAAVLIGFPFILHQIWGFIAPALYSKEKNFALPLFVSSVFLFYSGVAFTKFVITPIVYAFVGNLELVDTANNFEIRNLIDVTIKMYLVFGVAFEIPVAIVLLVKAGLVKVETLKTKRRYIIIGCFFVAMVLTPPDMISQTILAVPMILLFELGLFVAARMKPPITDESDDEDDSEEKEKENSIL